MTTSHPHMRTRSVVARLAFWMIRLMHDSWLVRLFRKPTEPLRSLGVAGGQKVVEIGCGPGFYTLPAARLLGAKGQLVALDVNPHAIAYVAQKLRRRQVTNARALLANAADTSLPDHQFDLAFFIGVPRLAGGLGPVLEELRRVLTTHGVIAFHLGRWREQNLVEQMQAHGFGLEETDGRVRRFRRTEAETNERCVH